MNAPTCPFQVGDRIHEMQMIQYGFETVGTDLLDRAKPDATVIEITPEGFVYEYDHPIHMGRPFWGEQTGGTCFPEGYSHWRKISS